MRLVRPCVLLGPAMLALAACATRPSAVTTPSTHRSAAPPPVRHVGPECDTAIVHARMEPDDGAIAPPIPKDIALPPLPVPMAARGARVHISVPVDSAGAPQLNGIEIGGAPLPDDYRDRLRQTVLRYAFVPAGYHDCAVPGIGRLVFDLQ